MPVYCLIPFLSFTPKKVVEPETVAEQSYQIYLNKGDKNAFIITPSTCTQTSFSYT